MSAVALEAFLARLYTDADLRARFLAAPRDEALAAGLCESDAHALVAIDRAGLEMAAASFAHKRAGRSGAGRWQRWRRWLRAPFGHS